MHLGRASFDVRYIQLARRTLESRRRPPLPCMGNLFVSEPRSTFTAATHKPGFFFNQRLNDLTIKELRRLRVTTEDALRSAGRCATDEQVAAELVPLVAEIAKREAAEIVQ